MGNENIFTVLVVFIGVISTIVGVWAVTRKNASEVAKAKALSDVRAQDAETKERADLIEMIREHGKNSMVWLEALKITEHKREMDYATLKAIIEDGTQETINSRTKLLSGVGEIQALAKEHNTGITNNLDELKRELASAKVIISTLPDANAEIKQRLDRLLGYIERLLPKLRTDSQTLPAVTLPNGATIETTTTLDIPPSTSN